MKNWIKKILFNWMFQDVAIQQFNVRYSNNFKTERLSIIYMV